MKINGVKIILYMSICSLVILPLTLSADAVYPSPLKQIKSGVALYDIQCNDGKVLVALSVTKVVCVYQSTAEKRNFTVITTNDNTLKETKVIPNDHIVTGTTAAGTTAAGTTAAGTTAAGTTAAGTTITSNAMGTTAKNHISPLILHAQWKNGVIADLYENSLVVVSSNGIPEYDYSDIPKKNPHDVKEQDFHFTFPLYPKYAGDQIPTRPGPIGMTLDGSVFFNPYDRDGNNANDSERLRFDSCSGHANAGGIYHTHQLSACFEDGIDGHSEIFGFVIDGFAVYGYNGINGTAPVDLDECNGHNDLEEYHYHATEKYPYLVGCYNGIQN